MRNGKVYPIIRGTVYIRMVPRRDRQFLYHFYGCHPDDDHDSIQEQLEAGEVPHGITVLEYDKSGIDPYKFLDLP